MLGSVIVLAGLVGSAAALSPPTPAPTPRVATDACADADGDGRFTVADGVQALRAAVGLASTCTPFRCDLDADDAITVTDGVAMLRHAAGLGIFAYRCPLPTRTLDFSAFGSFTLTRSSALGFCPRIGSVLNARIHRQTAGHYLAQLSVAEERPLGDAECVDPFGFGDATCVAPRAVPDRVLEDDDIEMLRTAFEAITVYEARDLFCARGVYDPCIVNALRWDAFVVTDHPCGAPWLGWERVEDITDVLDRLLPASEDVAR
jgi:hypothetical protein